MDGMGRTPLGLARMIAGGSREESVQLKMFEPGQNMKIGEEMIEDRGLTRTVDFSDQSTISYDPQMSYPCAQKTPDQSMIQLLLSVGAAFGSLTSPEEDQVSSLLGIKSVGVSDSPLESKQVATPLALHSDSPSLSKGREYETKPLSPPLSALERDCNSENYCVRYNLLDNRISKRLKDLSHTLTPEEALELVDDMRQREQFRRKYGSRILCLDGGGMRGLVTLCVLQEIERRMNMSITEIFDWIVGTSTGGIIALGLCYGECTQISPQQLAGCHLKLKC